jgi:dihydrofolate reductase
MRLSIIVAVADNRVIGREGDLPWRLSADLKRFKALTMGHHLLMGRKTFESIGTVLPGRTTVVISRGQPDLPTEVRLVHSLEQAVELARAHGDDEPFIAGGAEIYAQALPAADRLYFTRVHADSEGDTLFPAWQEAEWQEVFREDHPADDRNAHPYSFLVYERRSGPTF